MKKLIFAALLMPCIAVADWGGSVGVYGALPPSTYMTTGAEYGSGPMIVLEAHRPITESIEFSVTHKSYLLTGAPFNNNYESSYTAIGVRWTWGSKK